MNGRFPAQKSTFTPWWWQHWIAGFIGLTLLIGIAGQVNLLRQIGRPFPGFMSYSNLHGGYWTVAENTPPWWTGIKDTGLQYSDRILKLDGQPFGADQGAVFEQACRANKPVTVTIFRQGQERELQTAVIPFSLTHFLEIKTTHIIIGLGFWLLAVTIYATRPDEPLNRLFALVCCLIAINQWLWIRFLFHLEPHPLSIALDFIVLILFYSFCPPLVAHTALLFPPVSRWARPRILACLYGLTPLFLLIFISRRLFLWQGKLTPLWLSQLEQATFHTTQLLGLTAILLFILRLIVLAYRQHQARLPMFQYHILLVGFLFPALYSIRIVRTSVGGTNFSSWQHLIDWRYLFLATPLAIAFVIIRYQTFRSSNKMILVVFALIVSALAASISSTFLLQTFPDLVGRTDVIPLFIPLFALLFLFGLSWLYLNSPGGILGWLLHREARQYGDVKVFGQSIMGQTNLQELPPAIIQALRQLNIEQAAIWLKGEETAVCQLAAHSDQWHQPLPRQLPLPAAGQGKPGQVIRVNSRQHPTPPWLSDLEAQPSIKLVGLLGHGEIVGLMALGTRWDEEIYTDRDLEIMALVVQQISLFLLTAMQINELRQVPHRILNAQEQERHRIACELHDTTQQFLGRLPFRLAVSRKQLHTNPQKSDRILQECLDEISEAAMTLRHIRGSLSPSLAEASLSQSLPALIEQFQRRTAIPTQLQLPAQLDKMLSVNGRYALYRVMQQALDNIEAHAQATAVAITLQPEKNKLSFHIIDNGIGISTQKRQQAEAAGSFGLHSMVTRIAAQGGELIIHPTAPQGTTISGWLPRLEPEPGLSTK